MKKILVCGAGGFIGTHLVAYLKKQGNYVRGADLKYPEYSHSDADDFQIVDLRDSYECKCLLNHIDEVYQLAADMGGAGYIFTGEHDADVMTNSAVINLNILKSCINKGIKKIFYSSSACVYNQNVQLDPLNAKLSEDMAYPADPDSEYGWEKLFSERLYLSYARNYGINVKIARFHNIFGELGAWNNGREKAPAAICRKVAEAKEGDIIEIWGDGKQTRSFLYITECLEGIQRLMDSDFSGPVNIGSEEMVAINELAEIVIGISGKKLTIKNIPSNALGVRGRNSDNTLIRQKLNWTPQYKLQDGLIKLYEWIDKQIKSNR